MTEEHAWSKRKLPLTLSLSLNTTYDLRHEQNTYRLLLTFGAEHHLPGAGYDSTFEIPNIDCSENVVNFSSYLVNNTIMHILCGKCSDQVFYITYLSHKILVLIGI